MYSNSVDVACLHGYIDNVWLEIGKWIGTPEHFGDSLYIAQKIFQYFIQDALPRLS